jgi:hypothetical protein
MKEALGSGKVIWLVVATAFLYVVWFNFNKFVVTENYDFFVEAPCDAKDELCYLRSCEEEECPTNGLESYKVWKLVARDLSRCADDTCDRECETGQIQCEQVPCNPGEENCS